MTNEKLTCNKSGKMGIIAKKKRTRRGPAYRFNMVPNAKRGRMSGIEIINIGLYLGDWIHSRMPLNLLGMHKRLSRIETKQKQKWSTRRTRCIEEKMNLDQRFSGKKAMWIKRHKNTEFQAAVAKCHIKMAKKLLRENRMPVDCPCLLKR